MKAISLWQPWATLMAIGAKKIETRSWATRYRGPLIIHAAKRWTLEQRGIAGSAVFVSALEQHGYRDHNAFPLGAALAVVDLVDCVQHVETSAEERLLGDFLPGRWFWITENVRPFDSPIPMTGARRLFDVTDKEVLARALAVVEHGGSA